MYTKELKWNYDAWVDYLYWQSNDKAKTKRINQLIKEICRNPFEGIGKPEPLKGTLFGFWSRRIDDSHRIVYSVEDDAVVIMSCRGHYE